jgi:hypothetical protein
MDGDWLLEVIRYNHDWLSDKGTRACLGAARVYRRCNVNKETDCGTLEIQSLKICYDDFS